MSFSYFAPLVTAFLLTNTVKAGPPVAAPVYQAPSNIQPGNQYYDGGVSGLDEYMRELKQRDPKAHAELETGLDSLKMKRLYEILVPAALFVGGIAAVAIGGESSPSNEKRLLFGLG